MPRKKTPARKSKPTTPPAPMQQTEPMVSVPAGIVKAAHDLLTLRPEFQDQRVLIRVVAQLQKALGMPHANPGNGTEPAKKPAELPADQPQQ